MTTLVVGGSGATGKHVVRHLLNQGQKVKVIVRSPEKLPESWKQDEHLTIIQASLLELSDAAIENHLVGCHAIASCLGHNMTWKGIFGEPRSLVRDSVKKLTHAIKSSPPVKPVKLVLMNTAGNRNGDLNEEISLGQKLVMALIRLLLPPHRDNEEAADYLRINMGQSDPSIEWVVVRPDGLVNDKIKSDYQLFPSPVRSAIFNPGKTSRINVGHFMSELLINHDLWIKWKGKMPVIYNDI